ncbi:MAG: DUF1016 family protein [Chitinispirillaceae bacterium]|nr:DUF1016 family protein [Chitinispirillaceae bacterium]
MQKMQSTILLNQIRELIAEARVSVVRNIDFIQVWTNFHIGRMIVEHEQQGSHRAGYSEKLLINISEKLTHEFGRGFTDRNLRFFRQFYLTFKDRTIWKSPISKLYKKENVSISQSQVGKSIEVSNQGIVQSLIAQSCPPGIFTLSWTHYLFLMSIGDQDERSFYEIEATSQHWSVRELKRQFNTSLYERLALSRNKSKVKELVKRGHIIEKPEDTLKQPYVLEFLGLDEKEEYTETELETAIINKIEHFLLELGKGFLFEARQKRITIKEKHFHVDLVFYNRLLRCYVLIDLKIGELTHQDIGQMQMYVNHFDRNIKLPEENPTAGIILCKHHEQAIVEMTLPENNQQIFAGKYRLLIPSKAQLRKQIESVQL